MRVLMREPIGQLGDCGGSSGGRRGGWFTRHAGSGRQRHTGDSGEIRRPVVRQPLKWKDRLYLRAHRVRCHAMPPWDRLLSLTIELITYGFSEKVSIQGPSLPARSARSIARANVATADAKRPMPEMM